MEVIKTAIDGVFILEPRIFNDARGYFFESFSGREFEEKVCRTTFVQDNESFSTYGVLRGLHFQKPPFTQSKLVRVIKGAVLDVATERKVLRNIMQDTYPRTCIVTTHRPTVLNICTRVYAIRDKRCEVLGDGEIQKMVKEF